MAAGRNVHASLYGRAAAGAENPGTGRYSDEIAVITGASKGSIAASVNDRMENIGARRLHTILEKVVEEISRRLASRGGRAA